MLCDECFEPRGDGLDRKCVWMIVFGRYHLDCFNNATVPVICMTGALAAIKASRRRVFRTGTAK